MKGQHEKAIELYEKVLEELDGTADLGSELQLFNKVGDLYLKLGKVTAGVETYERAITRYEEAGFPNNAIALCNKVLRTSPGRTPVYLKLAKLMLERGFVAESKQNLLEYADRMQAAGQLEEAFRALKDFADLSSDNEEIRLLLAEQLQAAARTDEAREQLAKLYAEVEAQGDERKSRATLSKMKAIDPDYDVASAPKHKVKSRQQKSSDLVFLDLDEEPAAPAAVEEEPETFEPQPAAAVEDLAIETSAIAGAEEATAVEIPGLDIERTSLVEEEEEAGAAGAGLDIERVSLVEEEEEAAATEDEIQEVSLMEPEPTEEIEPIALDEIDLGDLGAGAAALDLDVEIELEPEAEPAVAESERVSEGALDVPDLDLGEGFGEEAAAEPVAATADEGALGDLGLIETELEEEVGEEEEPEEVAVAAPVAEARPTDPEALEAMVADDPDNASLHRSLAEALLERGDRERGLEELGLALGFYEEEEEWDRAEGVAQEILRIDPNSIPHQQKRVELAFRKGDKTKLADAYLGLANALFRSGAAERARAVYQRVLEHDPDNESALLAIETLQPVPEEAPAPKEEAAVGAGGDGGEAEGDFIDLGALILEEAPKPKDTRMRIEEEEPTGDEQRDFDEMLSAFKKGIEANVADEDWEAHYDLGVAFKEMGLLDEAIAEFQKSLRAPEARLKTAEALGLCFYEKGQFSVAATVLRRAVDADSKGDEAKISLLYWIGRCDEEQGKNTEALAAYQRVFAVDINFQDISDRVKALA